MKKYIITTQRELRQAFWFDHPKASKKLYKGDYITDTRVAFCDYIDQRTREGTISAALAARATLK